MQVGQSARTVLRLGCGVLLFAALAGMWETLASQAPGGALYIGMLPGPIELLRETAVTWGLLLVVSGLLLTDRPLPARWLSALYVGTTLTLGSAIYGAATGMHGVQARDLRADAMWLFAIKYAGRALLTVSLFEIARRSLARRQ
jgi:glycerol uptake facilitator-like aquaporin